VTATPDLLIDEWLLAPASVHDIRVADEILAAEESLTIIGDGAYNGQQFEQRVWDDAENLVLPMRRSNQIKQWTAGVRRLLIGIRMRVETVFSQLETVFGIESPGARSLSGLICRVASKILAHTFCFLWPKLQAT